MLIEASGDRFTAVTPGFSGADAAVTPGVSGPAAPAPIRLPGLTLPGLANAH